jgi:hypothetical protein
MQKSMIKESVYFPLSFSTAFMSVTASQPYGSTSLCLKCLCRFEHEATYSEVYVGTFKKTDTNCQEQVTQKWFSFHQETVLERIGEGRNCFLDSQYNRKTFVKSDPQVSVRKCRNVQNLPALSGPTNRFFSDYSFPLCIDGCF